MNINFSFKCFKTVTIKYCIFDTMGAHRTAMLVTIPVRQGLVIFKIKLKKKLSKDCAGQFNQPLFVHG